MICEKWGLVVRPIDGDVRPITVMERTLNAPHEVTGVGTLFLYGKRKAGAPHASLGGQS